jgi:hypothetical protein
MMIAQPDSIANRSPESMHVRGGDSAHQQIVQIGDKTKNVLLLLALVAAVSIAINVLCLYQIDQDRMETRLKQYNLSTMQDDFVNPLKATVDQQQKEIQALDIAIKVIGVCKK